MLSKCYIQKAATWAGITMQMHQDTTFFFPGRKKVKAFSDTRIQSRKKSLQCMIRLGGRVRLDITVHGMSHQKYTGTVQALNMKNVSHWDTSFHMKGCGAICVRIFNRHNIVYRNYNLFL